MKQKASTRTGAGRSQVNANHPKPGFKPIEKTSVGGAFNSGVTSDNPEEKRKIEKQASLKKEQPKAGKKGKK